MDAGIELRDSFHRLGVAGSGVRAKKVVVDPLLELLYMILKMTIRIPRNS